MICWYEGYCSFSDLPTAAFNCLTSLFPNQRPPPRVWRTGHSLSPELRNYVLLAAGEFNSRTGRLRDHQRNRVPSLDVVDFSKLYNVEGVADPLTVHPWLEKGCGNQEGEKGCFGYPYDCVRYASCKLLATYKKNGNRLSMQLQVRNQYFRFHWID